MFSSISKAPSRLLFKQNPLVLRAASVALLALVLRIGMAVLTEYKPIFPPYYYTDAAAIDQEAWRIATAWSRSEPVVPKSSRSQRLEELWLACLYRVFGHKPLAGKLANTAFAALAIFLFGLYLSPVFGPEPALGGALLIACWPSNIFFTSQILKESLAFLAETIALGQVLRHLLKNEKPPLSSARARLPATIIAIVGLGLLRGYLMFGLCLAVAASRLVLLPARRAAPSIRQLAMWSGVLLACIACYFAATRFSVLSSSSLNPGAGPVREDFLGVPTTYVSKTNSFVFPLSPDGISKFRQERQLSDRTWAQREMHREIGTQLFPDVQFHSWLDVLLFLPKGAFYVMFMPLPGLYPMDGKLGRIMASIENVLWLFFAMAALLGFAKEPKSPPRLFLFLFVSILAAGFALLEFDLGSATRHRLLYLPFLLPFGLAWLRQRRRPDVRRA